MSFINSIWWIIPLVITHTFSYKPFMARVTVEDCIKNVDSLFDLVLLASHRAKVLNAGNEAQVPLDNDKSTVIALREIAVETVTYEELREAAIESHQRQIEVDEPDQENLSLLSGEKVESEEIKAADGLNEDLLRALMEAKNTDKE